MCVYIYVYDVIAQEHNIGIYHVYWLRAKAITI